MEYDVTIDRNLWIGGSDIPAIMGISDFTTRWELLLIKAGLKEIEFTGNRYTEYGKIIEPQIRAHINKNRKKKFEPNRVYNGVFRCHSDGFNGECILEIKSTSQDRKILTPILTKKGYKYSILQSGNIKPCLKR